MEQPVRYVLVENGIAVNIIWLLPGNAVEFPNALPYDGNGVRLGERYPITISE